MGNMSYCRFENTYRDLLDCLNNMNNELSESEAGYRERLVDVCREIIDEYELNKMSDVDEFDSEDDDDDAGVEFVIYKFPNADDEEDSKDDDNNDEIPWDTQTR
jgi:hypothetical protein